MSRLGTLSADMWGKIHLLEKLARTPVRPITMQQLTRTNSAAPSALIKNAEWIRDEMQVRFAHRLWDFNRQPHIVLLNPSIRGCYELYWEAFLAMRNCQPIKDAEAETAFTEVLHDQVSKHSDVINLMRNGVRELRSSCPDAVKDVDAFLERLFVTRISRRVILEHHIAIHTPRPEYAGVVHLKCRPADIMNKCAEEVAGICTQFYGIAPHVRIEGNLDTSFSFIPEHIHIIFYECLKNAMRATVDFCTLGNSLGSMPMTGADLPEIVVQIYKGPSDVIIKMSDKGGGILPNRIEKIWSYGYSTADESQMKRDFSGSFGGAEAPTGPDGNQLTGFGFGLPLARAYARYFGGDIHIQSMFGHGTDTYINLNHVGDQKEALVEYDLPHW